MTELGKFIVYGLLCTASLMAGPAGWAADTYPAGVAISVRHSVFAVRVDRPVPLSIVIESLCKASAMNCEGTALASSSTVAPLSISGSWSEVIEKLLLGSGLNYISMGSVDGGRGRLWISNSSSAPALSGACPSAPSEPSTHGRERSSESGPNASCETVAGDVEPTAVSVAPVQLMSAAVASSEQSEASTTGAGGMVPIPSARSPLLEAGGSATASANSEHSESPFPEADAPVTPEKQTQSSGSPFPESLVSK